MRVRIPHSRGSGRGWIWRRSATVSKILIVDDDANIRAILKYRLEKEDFAVRLASNGLDALEQIDRETPDLVVLDLMMPKMDGLELLRRLRETPQTEDTPVIVLTALGHSAYSERSRELGAISLMEKPFSPRDLVQEIKAAMNGEDSREEEERRSP